jgi:nucleotidyltransferase AbiEii toxin of type IV toxin-antitoxin system
VNEILLKASDYGDRENQAVFSVLVELAQILGSQHGNFVVVGGFVPSLLYAEAIPKHVGTLDIDLDLNPEALGDYDYAELVTELENHDYERNIDGLKPFQMQRTIDLNDGTTPIPVIIDLLMPKDAVVKEHNPPLIDGLRVLPIDGGIYALKHYQEITIDGNMPDGRPNKVKVLVATPPALLVMKGYAIVGRDKRKDAYDIWFCIRNFEGGEKALAEECKPLLEEEEAKQAFINISDKFRTEDDFGPRTVREFLEASPDKCGDMTLEQIQTDAYIRVNKWCKLLGLRQ